MNTDALQDMCKVLSTTVCIAVLQFIREHGPVSVRDVASAFFGSPERPLRARRLLTALRKAGLCSRLRVGRRDLYTYTGQAALSLFVEQLQALLGDDDDSDSA